MAERLRVIHVITDLGQGGAEAMLEKLITVSQSRNDNVEHDVISLRTPGVVGPRLSARGIGVEILGIVGPLSFLRGTFRLWSRLRRARGNVVVQTWMYHGDLIGGLAARMAGIRRVYWNLRQELRGIGDLRLTTRLVVRAGACLSRIVPLRIICCAESARRSHVLVGYASERCVVIDNGFDVGVMRPLPAAGMAIRAELGIENTQLLVGVVGRRDPQKDQETFLAASAIVARSVPQARFLLVGRGIDVDVALRASVRGELLGRVVFLGQREDIAAIMSALDILVLSSRWEGFPNVLGEGMACEVPCVTTDVGDARRIVGEEQLVVPPGDAASLAQCVIKLCNLNQNERRELGRRLRRRIVEEFSIAATWDRYLTIYLSGA